MDNLPLIQLSRRCRSISHLWSKSKEKTEIGATSKDRPAAKIYMPVNRAALAVGLAASRASLVSRCGLLPLRKTPRLPLLCQRHRQHHLHISSVCLLGVAVAAGLLSALHLGARPLDPENTAAKWATQGMTAMTGTYCMGGSPGARNTAERSQP